MNLRLSYYAFYLFFSLATSFSTSWAALDSTSSTDDHSINTPTQWWTYDNISPSQLNTYLSTNSARLTDLDIHTITNGVPTFTVRMVKNSGAYAVPTWWWRYGATAAEITSFLKAQNGRLIEIKPYDSGNGVIRFAAIIVSNTGASTRTWGWLPGASASQITTYLNNTGHRLIDIHGYWEDGIKKYAVIGIANTNADAKKWEWWINQTPSSIASKLAAFKGRIVKLDRQSDGTYNFIQVANTNTDASSWWYYYGLTSANTLINYANQLVARPINIITYLDANGIRRYDVVFIDNTNTSTGRMRNLLTSTFWNASGSGSSPKIFEAFLKRIDQGAQQVNVSLNSDQTAEVASSLKALHLLHAMRQIQAGTDTLPSSFVYYEYDPAKGSNACPIPSKETAVNKMNNYDFDTGLTQMMSISDNRTTRGTVLRYGGSFTPFNNTASWAGLTHTTLNHNIGCGYWNVNTGIFDPTHMRNNTSADDLAKLYEGVWNSTLLNETNGARSQYLRLANPVTGVDSTLQTVINQEANKLGKSSTIASSFGSLIKRWGKGGNYNTCLPNTNGGCGQQVIVISRAGLIRLPIKVNGVVQYRTYSFATLISDVPVPCWEDNNTSTIECPVATEFSNAFYNGYNELFRDEIRSALMTW
jgi:hypothetical protein